MQWPDELSLLYTIALNVLVFAGAYRWVGRAGRLGEVSIDGWQRVCDALLLMFAVQYLAVGLPGLLGVLSLATMTLVAVALCGLMGWSARSHSLSPVLREEGRGEGPSADAAARADRIDRGKAPHPKPLPRVRGRGNNRSETSGVSQEPIGSSWSFWACIATTCFAGAFLASVVWAQLGLAVAAEDSLTYHLPAAAQWLAHRRIDLFATWFFNPANTFSPLAGSVFMAWLIAPMHNDIVVRFVQVPPLVLVFVATVQLCRSIGCGTLIGLLLATAAISSQPFIREAATVVKDDLFVCAFFLCAVIACDAQRIRHWLAPWRVGIGVGLMLAVKYTAVYELPLLLLLIDAPLSARWKWKQWGIVAGCIALLAGPWYLRNIFTTGNPVFPVEVSFGDHALLRGLFHTQRSLDLRTLHGIWEVLTQRSHSVPVVLFYLLGGGWVMTAVRAALVPGRALREPLIRLCVIGPAVGIGLFLMSSPYPEIRFIFPSILLVFACFGWVSQGVARLPALTAALATLPAIAAVATSFPWESVVIVLEIAAPVALSAFAIAFVYLRFRQRVPAVALAGRWSPLVAAVMPALVIYIYWPGYVRLYREDSVPMVEREFYGDEGAAWQFVRANVLADVPIAYTNTHLVHPLLGMEHRRRVFYVPVRRDVTGIRTMPHFPRPVAGEEVTAAATRLLNAQPDADVWLARLRESGAGVLFVATIPDGGTPPEREIAERRPDVFRLLFGQGDVRVYQINFKSQ